MGIYAHCIGGSDFRYYTLISMFNDQITKKTVNTSGSLSGKENLNIVLANKGRGNYNR